MGPFVGPLRTRQHIGMYLQKISLAFQRKNPHANRSKSRFKRGQYVDACMSKIWSFSAIFTFIISHFLYYGTITAQFDHNFKGKLCLEHQAKPAWVQKYNEPNLKVDQGGITLNELADTGYRKDYADLQGTTDLRLVATLGTSIALKSYEFGCVGRVRFLSLYKT